jgi:hypothetical protein
MISEDKQTPQLPQTAVMPSVISNDDLKLAHEKLLKAFEPIQAELDIAKEKYNKAKKELEDSFKATLEKYYDQQLLDKNGTSIKNNSIITNGKDFYQVTERGMQIIYGTMLFNNRVNCKKLDKDLRPGKKEHSFSARDLTDFVVQH